MISSSGKAHALVWIMSLWCFVFSISSIVSFFLISHEVHDSCMNHILPLTAPRWTNGSLGEQIFYFLIIANLWILSRSKDMAAVLCPPTLPSSYRVNIAFFYEERGGYLLPTRWWSIRRRSSLLTSPFSDPSISLLSGLSQQSMRCLFFTCIFIFRHLAAPAQRYRGGVTLCTQGGVQGFTGCCWWGHQSIHTAACYHGITLLFVFRLTYTKTCALQVGLFTH